MSLEKPDNLSNSINEKVEQTLQEISVADLRHELKAREAGMSSEEYEKKVKEESGFAHQKNVEEHQNGEEYQGKIENYSSQEISRSSLRRILLQLKETVRSDYYYSKYCHLRKIEDVYLIKIRNNKHKEEGLEFEVYFESRPFILKQKEFMIFKLGPDDRITFPEPY